MPIFLLSFFKSWKAILAVLVAIIIGIIVLRFHSLEHKLKMSQDALKVEQENNLVLRGNLDQAIKINKDNEAIAEQLKADKEQAVAAVAKLGADAAKATEQADQLKQKLNKITTAPVQLSPYIASAIEGVQQMRDSEQGIIPTPLAPAPTVPAGKLTVNRAGKTK